MAGFSLALLGVRLPAPLARSIDMLSLTAAGMALFVIGGTLVGIKVRGNRNWAEAHANASHSSFTPESPNIAVANT